MRFLLIEIRSPTPHFPLRKLKLFTGARSLLYQRILPLDPLHRELIRIRASQINGCAYCVNYHVGDALKLGESAQKLFLVDVWRESPNVFSKEEQLLFAMTEELTLIHNHGLSDQLYEQSIATFGEVKTAQVIMTVITINAWNRIGVGLKMQPEVD